LQLLANEIVSLINLYSQLRQDESNYEMREGMLVCQDITRGIQSTLQPIFSRYNVNHQDDQNRHDVPEGGVLANLQYIYITLSKIETLFIIFTPTAGALWDQEFVEAITFSTTQLDRQVAWSKYMLKVKAPQTLIVPHT
jgi:hypothetical protein